jgi:phosphopantetheine--protein transferase-like protein
MNFENFSVGTDIEEIKRFENKTLENDKSFLERVFTPAELDYCFSKSLPQFSLCGRYCAKEAVVKALSLYNIHDVFYSDIEVINKNDGSPYVVIKKYPQMQVKISLSHAKTYASATAITYYEQK